MPSYPVLSRRLAVVSVALGAFFLSSAGAAPFGQVGIGLKTGEAAGGFGAQAMWNYDRHWQVTAGVGGTSIPFFFELGGARTDSYYILPKYYFKHMYIGAGYSLKRARINTVLDDVPVNRTADAHGIPMALGYEFGHRKGFFFSTSIGFLQSIKGGGRDLVAVSADGTDTSSIMTASSGPSIGLSLGYYFDLDP